MAGQQIGYTTVSSVDQHLEGFKLDETFADKASGKDRQRPRLNAHSSWDWEGDTVVVHSLIASPTTWTTAMHRS